MRPSHGARGGAVTGRCVIDDSVNVREDFHAGSRASDAGIGVVIVHFGPAELTFQTIASVLDDSSAVQREVVVVDNGGNLPQAAVPAAVKVIPSPDNPGYGAGLNRGVRFLEEQPVCRGYLCLNNDVVLFPGYLDAANAALARDDVGAAGGPTYEDVGRQRIWYAGGSVNYMLGAVRHDLAPGDVTRRRAVGFIPGAAMAISARAWNQVGGFDERFFLYHEDLDLCLRLRRGGWRLEFEPDMQAVHMLGGATGSGRRSAMYLEHMTRTRLRAFRPLPYRLYLAVLHSGWTLLRSLALLARQEPDAADKARALLRGHSAALRTVFNGRPPARHPGRGPSRSL